MICNLHSIRYRFILGPTNPFEYFSISLRIRHSDFRNYFLEFTLCCKFKWDSESMKQIIFYLFLRFKSLSNFRYLLISFAVSIDNFQWAIRNEYIQNRNSNNNKRSSWCPFIIICSLRRPLYQLSILLFYMKYPFSL